MTKDANRLRDGKRPAVLYSSAQHAREWITPGDEPPAAPLLPSTITDGNPDIREIIDTTELWFVPVANPDGYDFTFTEGQSIVAQELFGTTTATE